MSSLWNGNKWLWTKLNLLNFSSCVCNWGCCKKCEMCSDNIHVFIRLLTALKPQYFVFIQSIFMRKVREKNINEKIHLFIHSLTHSSIHSLCVKAFAFISFVVVVGVVLGAFVGDIFILITVLCSVLFLQHYKANEMTRIHRTDFISAQINRLSCDVYFMSNKNTHCVNQPNENWIGMAQWCYKKYVFVGIGSRHAWVIRNTLTREQSIHMFCASQVLACEIMCARIAHSHYALILYEWTIHASCLYKQEIASTSHAYRLLQSENKKWIVVHWMASV